MSEPARGPDGRFQALHVTYIEADGSDKLRLLDEKGEKRAAKKVRGSPQGSALRLAAAAVIEDKVRLAGARASRRRFPSSRAAGCRAGRFIRWATSPGFLPPEGVEVFVWCRDADNGDPNAAACLVERGVQRLLRMGLDARVASPPDGMDFNDVLRAGQGRAA